RTSVLDSHCSVAVELEAVFASLELAFLPVSPGCAMSEDGPSNFMMPRHHNGSAEGENHHRRRLTDGQSSDWHRLDSARTACSSRGRKSDEGSIGMKNNTAA